MGSARLPYQFLETSNLEVVSLQSLSLVVLAPLGGCGQHVKDCIVDRIIRIRSDHHLVVSCIILNCFLHEEGILCFLSFCHCVFLLVSVLHEEVW